VNQIFDAVAGHCGFGCDEFEVVFAPERIGCESGFQTAQVENERRESRSVEREGVVDVR